MRAEPHVRPADDRICSHRLHRTNTADGCTFNKSQFFCPYLCLLDRGLTSLFSKHYTPGIRKRLAYARRTIFFTFMNQTAFLCCTSHTSYPKLNVKCSIKKPFGSWRWKILSVWHMIWMRRIAVDFLPNSTESISDEWLFMKSLSIHMFSCGCKKPHGVLWNGCK